MIEVFKLTHGFYAEDVAGDFMEMIPSRARGHDFNIHKLRCRIGVKSTLSDSE